MAIYYALSELQSHLRLCPGATASLARRLPLAPIFRAFGALKAEILLLRQAER